MRTKHRVIPCPFWHISHYNVFKVSSACCFFFPNFLILLCILTALTTQSEVLCMLFRLEQRVHGSLRRFWQTVDTSMCFFRFAKCTNPLPHQLCRFGAQHHNFLTLFRVNFKQANVGTEVASWRWHDVVRLYCCSSINDQCRIHDLSIIVIWPL